MIVYSFQISLVVVLINYPISIGFQGSVNVLVPSLPWKLSELPLPQSSFTKNTTAIETSVVKSR